MSSQCYWGSEACRNGHITDCPAAGGRDPWVDEKTAEASAPADAGTPISADYVVHTLGNTGGAWTLVGNTWKRA
jgi:hypothetical protein